MKLYKYIPLLLKIVTNFNAKARSRAQKRDFPWTRLV